MTIYRYVVVGKGAFPTDMLRHDQSWPSTSTDAAVLMEFKTRSIALMSRAKPTPTRWASFGWRVDEGATSAGLDADAAQRGS